jgi:hypothetical protein
VIALDLRTSLEVPADGLVADTNAGQHAGGQQLGDHPGVDAIALDLRVGRVAPLPRR